MRMKFIVFLTKLKHNNHNSFNVLTGKRNQGVPSITSCKNEIKMKMIHAYINEAIPGELKLL